MNALEELNMIEKNLLKQTDGDSERAISRLIGHIQGLEIVLQHSNAEGWGKISDLYSDEKTESYGKTKVFYKELGSED